MSKAASIDSAEYLPVLDGLRAISIALVVVSHFGLHAVVPGGLGVTVFFFVSGFIITRLILLEYARDGHVSLGNFYLRRVVRLSPALLVYVALSVAIFVLAGWKFNGIEVLAAIFYWANYYHIFFRFTGVPDFGSPLLILWSLAVEEHFYMFFPFFLLALRYEKRRLLWFSGAILVVCIVWRLWLVFGIGIDSLPKDRIYKATDTRLDSILYGVFLSILIWNRKAGISLLQHRGAFIAGVSTIFLTLVVRTDEFRESVRYSLQGLAMIPIVYGLVFDDRLSKLRSILETRPMVLVGRWSYSLYLYHWLAVCAADSLVATKFSFNWIVVAFGLSATGMLFSYYAVEMPFMGLRRRLGSRAT